MAGEGKKAREELNNIYNYPRKHQGLRPLKLLQT
jgi:hypothetical protein